MFKRAIDILQKYYDLKVANIQFQNTLGESGSFSVRKVSRFISILFRKIIPLVFTKKYDILYYCVAAPSKLGLIKDLIFLGFLRLRAHKTVYHLHGAGGVTLVMHCGVIMRAWARLVLFEPDIVLRPPGMASDEADLCKAKHEKIIFNGIEDPITIVPDLTRRWPEAELSFTFVGLITEDKGVFDLVAIARLLREAGYRFSMNIVGEGAPSEIIRLQNLIRQFDLAEFVRLTGVLVGREKFELIQKTTIFLFPSYFRAESQPTAIMEALALGVPVVASDWRGISTIIDQGVNGYIVPPREPVLFCRAIIKVLTGGQIDSMRAAARRIFLERFTLDHHAKALMAAFQLLEADANSQCNNTLRSGAV